MRKQWAWVLLGLSLAGMAAAWRLQDELADLPGALGDAPSGTPAVAVRGRGEGAGGPAALVPPAYSLKAGAYAWAYTSALAIADMTADGRNDLIGILSETDDHGPFALNIFPQDASGVLGAPIIFELPSKQAAHVHRITPADLNKDGRTDLVFTPTYDDGFFYLLSRPGGGYEWREDRWINQRAGAGAAVVDKDGDGKLDVVAVRELDPYQYPQPNRGMLAIAYGDGVGGFDRHTSVEVAENAMHDLLMRDFDGDGKPDLLTSSRLQGDATDYAPRLRRNAGGGTFLAPTVHGTNKLGPILSLSTGDYNGDGRPDFAGVGYGGVNGGYINVFSQLADGSFAKTPEINQYRGNPLGLQTADLNQDGLPDLVHLNDGSISLVYYLRSPNGFEYPAQVGLINGYSPMGNGSIAVGDLSGDGVPEVAVASQYALVVAYGKLTPYAGVGGLPGAPVITSAVVTPGYEESGPAQRFDIQISPPANDGGTPITGYTVYSSPSGGWDLNAGSAAAKHQMTGLQNDTTYTFYARATNAAGQGPASAPSNPVTLGVPGSGLDPVIYIEAQGGLEGTGWPMQARFTISLDRPAPAGGVSFDFATSSGTAASGSDFVGLALQDVVIPAGQTRVVRAVDLLPDSDLEPDEVFSATLSDVHGALIGNATASATIVNDDSADARIFVTGQPVQEGETTAYYDVRLTKPLGQDVSFTVDTFGMGPTATAGQDFDARSLANQVIPAGQTKFTFSVPIHDDAIREGGEFFVVRISSVQGAPIATLGESYTAVIVDDEPLPSLSVDDVVIAEGTKQNSIAYVRVRASPRSTTAVTFSAVTLGGSAVEGSDFESRYLAGLRIPAGQDSVLVPVTIFGDGRLEQDESFTLRLENVVGATIGDGTGLVTLVNDDVPNGLSIGNVTVQEGSGNRTINFPLTLSEPSAQDVVFDVHTASGTGFAGEDFQALDVLGMTIPAGATSAVVAVTVHGDDRVEADETFTVNLANVSGAVVSDGQGLGRLLNDDVASASVEGFSVAEGDSGSSVAFFTIRLSARVQWPVYVHYAAKPDTASLITDFYPVLGQVTFDPGRTSIRIGVSVIGDATVEPDEKIRLELTGIDGANAGIIVADGAIINDDTASPMIARPSAGPSRAALQRCESDYRCLVRRSARR